MSFKITQKEGEFLINLARRSVEEYLESSKVLKNPSNTPTRLLEPHGVFVTINRFEKNRKVLRGCIGYPYPRTQLAKAVTECAISSATQDPRFHPLVKNELSDVVFEISILTKPKLLDVKDPRSYPTKIKVGRDGLIIERGLYKGLLLPQVPVELQWDEEEFLSQCCIKAGLPPDNWLLRETKIYTFQCSIVKEVTPNGKILVN